MPVWDEATRLAALERYAILDTGREQAFDDVAELAADLLDAPLAVVNFVASDRQWFKAEVGIGTDTLPLDVSICRHALLQPGVFVVPDLTEDPRFAHNPLVTAAEGLRFYAGALLATPEGLPLGTVCVLDTKARPDGISARQERALTALASQTMAQLELRRSEAAARAEHARAAKHSRRLSLLAGASSLLVAEADPQAAIPELLRLVVAGLRLDIAFQYACQSGGLGLIAAVGLTPAEEAAAARIELGQTICGLVAERREAMHVTGIQTLDDPHAKFLKAIGLDTYFSAPLVAGSDLLGTLSFGRRGEPFSAGELEVLGTIAGLLATTLERCHVEARLRENESRYAFLLELSDALRPLTTPADIIALSAERLGVRLGTSRVFYAEIASGRMHVEYDYAHGVPSLVGEHSLEAFGPALLAAYQAGAVLTIADVGTDERLGTEARAGLQARQVGAFIDVILFEEERGVGVLAVQSARPRAWALAEEELVREVAERIKVAIERVRAEATLAASENRLTAIFSQVAVGLSELSFDGAFLRVNDELCRMLGRSREELLSCKVAEVTHSDDVGLSLARFATAVEAGAAEPFDKRYTRPDGLLHRANSSLTRLDDEFGHPRSILAVTIDLTARRSLEEERARLAAAVEQSRDFIGVADLEGRVVSVNEAGRRLVGLPDIDTARATRIVDFFAPEDRDRVLREVLPTVRREGWWEGELHFRRFDTGEVIPVLYNIFPVRNEAGDVTGYGTVTRDFTEHNAAEAALRDAEERLRLAVDNAEVGFWDVDVVNDSLIWPPRTNAMFGISADVSVSMQDFYEGLHPDDRTATAEAYAASVDPARRSLYDVEYRTIGREDGIVRWIAAKGRGVFDEEGRCLRVAGTAVDITTRKVAEEALRASEALLRELNETLETQVSQRTAELKRYHDIVDATVTPICAFDADYRLIAFNRAHNAEFRRVNGFDTAIGDVFPDLFIPEQAATMRANMARVLAGESFTVTAEFGRPELGVPRWEISYTPLRDEAGQVIGAFHHAVDISDRLRAEEELEAAQEALRQSQKMEAMGSLTGGVAHDFNNLLTPIVGSLDMLQRKGVGTEREQRLIAGAAQSAERAKTLVQRLLAFARRQPLQPVPVDLEKLVEGMVELVDSTSGPRIKVETETASGLPAVQADPNQLEMAILNLAVNARDAMPDGGRLSISAMPEAVHPGHRSGVSAGQYVRLVVADTGVGMDEATLKRAIEPFYSTKGIGKGTGLGLSMVHGLAAQLGGGLTIQSKRGVGTSVELWLPVATEEERSVETAAEKVALAGAGIALLVDDEELVRASTADMLSDLGYSVTEAICAEEALRLIDEGLAPDLVVTDHLMPGMSGTELATVLKDRRPATKVLIVSGYAEDEGIAADLPRLTKPFLQAELAVKLAAFAK